jgi:hypothetical protein
MCLYGSRKNVSAGLCVYMGEDVLYQQEYVFMGADKMYQKFTFANRSETANHPSG